MPNLKPMPYFEGKPFDKSKIDWDNQSYDEFCDILEDVHGIEIKREH